MSTRIKLAILAAQLISIIGLLAFNFSLKPPASETYTKVLAKETVAAPSPKPSQLSFEIAQRVETAKESVEASEAGKPAKDSYVLAFIGDSMIETMGGALPYVYKELKAKYPETDFALYNYGIGSENVVEAISRFALPYSYKGQSHEPLPELGADIIVLGSYSYNPITPFDKNEAWLLLSDLINKAKGSAKKVYVLAEQAPLEAGFGQGAGGVNWPDEIAKPHTEKIILGLKNAVGLAETLDVGLINVFEQSKAPGSSHGNAEYVAVHDGIHYSEAGQEFSAKIIAETIELE